MRNITALLLLGAALSTAAQEQPQKPAGSTAASLATMCNTAAWALCIKAPCAKKPDSNNLYPCECIMQSGWNLGPNSCEDRAKNLTSTYSNNFNPYSATISCPTGTMWALCYGAKCERDPNDPSKATCKCPVLTTPMVVMVSRSECGNASKICGVLWSAASPTESKFANDHFYSWMKEHGMDANLPAPACPATASQ